MLIKGLHYRLFNIDDGSISRLWMPVKGGLDNPTDSYVQSLGYLRQFGMYVLEPGQMCGGSGFSGGGGGTDTNNFVMSTFADANLGGSNIAASTTYVLAQASGFRDETNVGAANGRWSNIVPVACTLKSHYWRMRINSLPSTNNVTHKIRKNDTTDTTGGGISWASTITAAVAEIGLSVSYSAADYWDAKFVVPAWAVNASSVYASCTTYFSVP